MAQEEDMTHQQQEVEPSYISIQAYSGYGNISKEVLKKILELHNCWYMETLKNQRSLRHVAKIKKNEKRNFKKIKND